jgi:hypothetical protein
LGRGGEGRGKVGDQRRRWRRRVAMEMDCESKGSPPKRGTERVEMDGTDEDDREGLGSVREVSVCVLIREVIASGL